MTVMQLLGIVLIVGVPLVLLAAAARATSWREAFMLVLIIIVALTAELVGLLLLSGRYP